MSAKVEYKSGDPRRVLEMAKENKSPTELIWGSQDPQESLRMARIIVEGGFLSLTLSDEAEGSFTYFKEASRGDRVPYFVDHFSMGAITEAPMLLGQFLFEFEKCPHEALRLSKGGSNRVYFRMNGPGQKDKRIEKYEFLTEDETNDVRLRLEALSEIYPNYKETINRLISTLER